MFLEPTDQNAINVLRRGIEGPVVMLNLLRFREVADYSGHPELAPGEPISGREAYDLYAAHTMPFLTAAGGGVLFEGDGGHLFIGPTDARWDKAILVRHASLDVLFGMAQDEAYNSGLGHRTAALEDSRLLPLEETG